MVGRGGIIPAHAGSTHSKPRNPANAATLAAATDITGHPENSRAPLNNPIHQFSFTILVCRYE